MLSRFAKRMLASLALCWAAVAMAAAPSAGARLQHFFHHVSTFQAHFQQVLKDDSGATIQRSSGEFIISRPGRFRWVYQKPYSQVIVSNGKTLWVYDKDLSQVTERPVSGAIHGTPAELLSGGEDIGQAFHIQGQDDSNGLHWVKLTPKDATSGQSDFKWVRLGFSDGHLTAMQLRDNLGETSHITFSQVEVNPSVPDSRFQFKVPKGVDVVR